MDARYFNGEPEERHDPNAGGRGYGYHCGVKCCGWRGKGGANAYDHHRATGHAIYSNHGIKQEFGCCAEHAHMAVASGE